jgi:hypothetical protein
MRQNASMSAAGKAVSNTTSNFTRAEIANMSTAEFTKNEKAINAQLEKYGAESFEE